MPAPSTAHDRSLRSRLFSERSIPHAFTTRIGGVSPAPFDSLNFGNPGDLPAERRDPATNIRANFDLISRDILGNQPTRAIAQVHQVHGSDVHIVSRDDRIASDPLQGNTADPKADALVTDDPARLIAVRVADCCPILLATDDGRAVAAVHAGWRGVISGVCTNAARILVNRFSGAPTSLIAAIGPCIGPDAFEVGPEVADEFRRAFAAADHPKIIIDRAGAKPHIDLQAALRAQLLAFGLPNDRIDTFAHCTVHARHTDGAPLFFSHRRDQALTGRMIAIIGSR
jgi:YfiH family protein